MLYREFGWASHNWMLHLSLRTLKILHYLLQILVNDAIEKSKATLVFSAFILT